MTRRKLLKLLLKTVASAIPIVLLVGEKIGLRKFIRAERGNCFPGTLRHLENINKQGKWSG